MRQVKDPRNRRQLKPRSLPASAALFPYLAPWVLLLFICATSSMAMTTSNKPIIKLAHSLASQGVFANKDLQQQQFYRAMAAYEQVEYHLAKRLLLPLAQRHHTEAEFYMGMMFDMGLGVAKIPALAAHWYKRAAYKGYHHAQHNLAVAYANGEGVQQDLEIALHWWERAARQGNTDSQYNLGIIYATGNESVKRDLQQAEKWWRKAAISGDAMAQYNLGALYANGEKKVSSYCEAIRWWQASARAGLAQALIAIKVLKQRPDYRPC